MWPLYYLYGVERAGRLSAQRFFGPHDWYREGAAYFVDGQIPPGRKLDRHDGRRDRSSRRVEFRPVVLVEGPGSRS